MRPLSNNKLIHTHEWGRKMVLKIDLKPKYKAYFYKIYMCGQYDHDKILSRT